MSDQKKNLPPQLVEELNMNAEREEAAIKAYPDSEFSTREELWALREAFVVGATWEHDQAKTASTQNRRVWLSLRESAEDYRMIAKVWIHLAEEANTPAEKEKNSAQAAKYEGMAKRFQELADAERETRS